MFQENQTYVPSNLSKQFQRVYGLSSFLGTSERQNKIWKDFQNFLSKNIVLIRGSWWDYFMRGWLGILRLSY